MWSREQLEEELKQRRLDGFSWGRFGEDAVQEIEGELGVPMGDGLRDFGVAVGNLTVPPFEIVVCGTDGAEASCAAATTSMRASVVGLPGEFIQIMECAGEVYFAISATEKVEAYDRFHILPGQQTERFDSFSVFLDWVFSSAEAIQLGNTKFQF